MMETTADGRSFHDTATMTLTGHLTELRARLIKCLLALAGGTLVAWQQLDAIMYLLTAPAGTLYFIKPAEAFFIYLKTALVSGAAFSSPVLFYQFWAFLVPAFTTHEKSVLAAVVPASLILFLAGAAFGFFLVLPQGLRFFLGFSGATVQPMISMESYLDFTFMLVLPFGIIFNLPLVLIILAKAGLVNSRQLKKIRRVVVFLSFVAAAIITPTTDMVSQCLLAVPMIVLFEAGRLFIKFCLRR